MAAEGIVTVNALLTNVSNRFKNQEYVGDSVFPMVGVAKESGLIMTYGKENLKPDETLRANKSKSNEAHFSVSNTTYFVQEHALSDIVTERDRANYDAPLNADVDTVELLTDKIQLRREMAAAAMAQTTTSWGTGASLVTVTGWAYNTTTSDPIVAAHSAAAAILLNAAVRPNQAVISWNVYNFVRDHVSLLDRIKYTQIGQLTPGLIAALWDVDQLVIGSAVRDAGTEGLSSSNTSVWGPSTALFHFAAPAPSLRKVSSGYLLGFNVEAPFTVRSWPEPQYKGVRHEVETSYGFKAVASVAAYLYHGVNRGLSV